MKRLLFVVTFMLGALLLAGAPLTAHAAPALQTAGACDGGEGVYLYEHANYTGSCLKFTGDAPDLRAQNFNDVASSIRFVGDWTATLYRDINYSGVSSTFVNNNPDLRNDAVGNDETSSLQVRRGKTSGVEQTCGEGDGVYLYADINFRGRCIKLTADAPDLRTLNFDDIASSIRMLGSWTVTLYRDLSGTGTASTFTADDPDLQDDVVGNDQVTSVRVQGAGGVPSGNSCDGGEGVYLYEHPSYQGRCVKLTADAPDLRTLSFDDTASSIRMVGSWTAWLYRDLSGTGISTTFTGDDANLADNPVGDNHATSVRVQRGGPPAGNACDGGEGVYLYEHLDYQGRCIKLTADAPDLRTLNFDDIVTSIRIVGSWTAWLYRDLNGAGVASTFTGNDPDLRDNQVGNDQATSVRVQRGNVAGGNSCDGGEGVYLYEHPNYQGRCVKLTADAPDLRTLSFDDIASSMRMVGIWTVWLYRDLSGTGVASTFTDADANLADDAVGDNQATSVRVQRR